MNAVMPFLPRDLSTVPKTMYRAASPAFVIQIFVPLSRYASPSRRADSDSDAASDPAPGSVRANAPSSRPGGHLREASLLLLVRPAREDAELGEDVDGEAHPERHLGRGDLLRRQRPGEGPQAGSAVALRVRKAGDPELAGAVEERDVVALLLVALRCAGGHLALRPVADGVADAALLLAEGEGVARRARPRASCLDLLPLSRRTGRSRDPSSGRGGRRSPSGAGAARRGTSGRRSRGGGRPSR